MANKKPESNKITLVEFKNKGKIKVVWNVGSVESSTTMDNPQHPDLQKAVKAVISFLPEYFDKGVSADNLSIKSVKIGHYEDKEGQSVQIKCVHTHLKSGQNVTLTTAKMQVHENHYGFETKLKKAINVLSEEAYQYAVNLKSSQLRVDDKAA